MLLLASSREVLCMCVCPPTRLFFEITGHTISTAFSFVYLLILLMGMALVTKRVVNYCQEDSNAYFL